MPHDLFCKLEDGRVLKYAIAYPLSSVASLHDSFEYVGTGQIHRVDRLPYTRKQQFRFYVKKETLSKYKWENIRRTYLQT